MLFVRLKESALKAALAVALGTTVLFAGGTPRADVVEIISIADWYGVSDADESDAKNQCGSVVNVDIQMDPANGDVTAAKADITRGAVKIIKDTTIVDSVETVTSDTIYPYADMDGGLPGTSSMEGVTEVEVTYTADADFLMTLSNEALDGPHGVTLVKGENITKKFLIADFKQPSWVEKADLVDLPNVKALGFEPASEAETEVKGKISIMSLKLTGYVAPIVENKDTIDLLGADAEWETWSDTAKTADVKLDSTDSKLSGATFTYPDSAEYASMGTVYIMADDFTFADMKRIAITYSSPIDLELVIPMPSTGDAGTAHKFVLSAGDNITLEKGLLDSRQPADEELVDLDLSKVTGIEISPLNAGESGTVTISSLFITKIGDAGNPVAITNSAIALKSINASVSAISANKMSISVPTTGTYGISIYAANGRLISKVSSNLTAGINNVSFDRSVISSGVAVVKVTGNGVAATSKIMIK